ncbi:RNA polymerase sigma factor [candidate division WOR-3 bacterium]|nr:RNA polymerase sigma factor [candidate division WOR-3 bacterium]
MTFRWIFIYETKEEDSASNLKMKDSNINIEKLKQGCEYEFERFYKIYTNRIFTIIYRVVGNEADAEDISLEVMMKVYDKIGTFRAQAKLSTWVYRIAYNQGISFLRKKKNVQPLEYAKVPYEDKHIQYLERKEVNDLVRSKLMELPEKHRVALTLYHFEDLSYKEIAWTMGTKMSTVKTYIHRGREELKALLGGINGIG